ncbi:carbohydrate kinase family protein [Nocardia sp. NBC_01499]|uniref:carbohydrate kinase family protein n=1 Tax=Nocardia sp. NBC_01499 TaxID=2903597 RepID=UPI0038669550
MAVQSTIVAVRSAFQRLSKGEGLTLERLRTNEVADTLLELPLVEHRVDQLGSKPPEALLAVVRELARQLPPTDRIIVDAELALRLLDGESALDLEQLYDTNLGLRRSYLVEHWHALHVAVGATAVPPTPTVRSLRDTPERNAFTALARAIAAGAVLDADAPPERETSPRATGPVVTIVGDAVIDEVLHADRIPENRRSTRSERDLQPGGKALYRAVAAARLGLDVRLLAAIGDDDNGRLILDHLRAENVDTELVQIVPNTPTPVVVVVMTDDGVRCFVNKNVSIRLTEDHLRTPAALAAFAASSAVLLTFEQPGDIVEQVLESLRVLPDRPLVLLHPAPSDEAPRHLHRFLGMIDHLVGSPGELERVAQDSGRSGGDTISRLRLLGSHSICVIEDFQASVHSDAVSAHIPRSSVGLEDAPGVRAVFSAALAYRLVTRSGPPTEQDFIWAAAAMVAARSGFTTMRDEELISDIDRIIRFTAEHQRAELLDGS